MATYSIQFVDDGPWLGLWEAPDEQAAYCRLRVSVGRIVEPSLLIFRKVFPVSEKAVRTYGEVESGWLWFLATSTSSPQRWELCRYQTGGRSFQTGPAPKGLSYDFGMPQSA